MTIARYLQLVVFLAWVPFAEAADITITFTAQQLTRFQAALGATQGLRDANGAIRAATNAEAKAWLIDQPRGVVQAHERAIEAQKISVPTFDPS